MKSFALEFLLFLLICLGKVFKIRCFPLSTSKIIQNSSYYSCQPLILDLYMLFFFFHFFLGPTVNLTAQKPSVFVFQIRLQLRKGDQGFHVY